MVWDRYNVATNRTKNIKPGKIKKATLYQPVIKLYLFSSHHFPSHSSSLSLSLSLMTRDSNLTTLKPPHFSWVLSLFFLIIIIAVSHSSDLLLRHALAAWLPQRRISDLPRPYSLPLHRRGSEAPSLQFTDPPPPFSLFLLLPRLGRLHAHQFPRLRFPSLVRFRRFQVRILLSQLLNFF